MLQKFVKHSHGTGGASSSQRPALSVIGPDVRIVGDIHTQGEMQIDGQVEGDITCQVLVVGEGGSISGEISAETVRVHGEVTGKIVAKTVAIARSAKVIGDITHECLEIEAGAHMEGHCIRPGTQAPALCPPAPEAEAEAAE